MKQKRFLALLLAALLLFSLTGCAASTSGRQEPGTTSQSEDIGGEISAFRPVDCGIQAQAVYEYPYIGLAVTPTETLREKLDSREVFLYNFEECTADAVRYAMMRFSAPTEAQRALEVMSIDFFGWEEELPKLGVIGVYEAALVAELNTLTCCDTHEKLGESADGRYVYYRSTNSGADTALLAELQACEISLTEMLPIDLENGYSAFADARVEGLTNVGNFTTEDIFGTAYDQTVFANYDLTLVNVFATWCSPCVQEMPELEKLRQEYAAKGIRLGIVAIVMDVRTDSGTDDYALDAAKRLYSVSEAQFPFLLPDETMLNGRLEGIMAYPESFFVDGNGSIVSEPYVGTNTQAGWSEIVASELAQLDGGVQ